MVLLALGSTLLGVAQGATILTFEPDTESFAGSTDQWYHDGTGNGPGAKWSGTKTLSDGTILTMSIDSGRLKSYQSSTDSWTNTAVLQEMNNTLGTSIASTQLSHVRYTASAAVGAHSQLSFTLSSSYTQGAEMVFYLLATTSSHENVDANKAPYPLTNLTVTGLTDSTFSWALCGGNGYESASTTFSVPQNQVALIKVTGTLGSDPVVFSSTSNKNAWAMAAYTVVPEPATATLSLLALAGMAARRRR